MEIGQVEYSSDESMEEEEEDETPAWGARSGSTIKKRRALRSCRAEADDEVDDIDVRAPPRQPDGSVSWVSEKVGA